MCWSRAVASKRNALKLAALAGVTLAAASATHAQTEAGPDADESPTILPGPVPAGRAAVQDSAPPLPDRPPVAADRCPPEPMSSEPRRRSPSVTHSRGET